MTPEEIALAIQAFLELEPSVQKGVAGLIHLIRKPKPTQIAQPTAAVSHEE